MGGAGSAKTGASSAYLWMVSRAVLDLPSPPCKGGVLSKGGVLTWLDDRGTETYRNSHSRADEGRTRDLRLERAVLSE